MKSTRCLWTACAALFLLAAQTGAHAQVAGTTTIGVAALQVKAVAAGWSARKRILGRTVYNDAGENVGKIEDLIVAPDDAVSFAIIGVGGFLGVKRHHVAIPVSLLGSKGSEFVLAGATKAAIKGLPSFDYAD